MSRLLVFASVALCVAGLVGEVELAAGGDQGIGKAVEEYFREVEEIERKAAEAKAAARKRLFEKLGKVGDDIGKSVIYVVKLPQGRHTIRWVLTGGMFQHNMLKFEDPQTGELLRVSHDSAQQQETGAVQATDLVEAGADPREWSKTNDPREWHWEPLGDLRLPAGDVGT